MTNPHVRIGQITPALSRQRLPITAVSRYSDTWADFLLAFNWPEVRFWEVRFDVPANCSGPLF